jgi:DNA-binding FadR family transcriptional regulator
MARTDARVAARAATTVKKALKPSHADAGRARIDTGSSDAIIRPLKTSERVARDIVRDIVDRRLASGDGLPAEAAMLEHYGVSRESLREGLRLLEVQGLITIRRGPGGGPMVGTVDPANLGRAASLYYYMAGATYRELMESWIISEAMMAERAARNPDAALRHQLMAPYIGAAEAADHETELEPYVHAQLDFHAAVARLGDNRVLELSLQVSGRIMSHHFAIEDDPRTLRDEIASHHHDLAKAIAAGRPGRAAAIMTEHLEFVRGEIERRLGRLDEYIDWR